MKRITGKPVIIGDRTLIPTIELSTYVRNISIEKNSEELTITGVTVTPVSVKLIEGEEEWTLHIPNKPP